MDESKKKEFMAYLDANIAECARSSAVLKADDRGDESVFARVRGNIFEVFKTVFIAMCGASRGDGERLYGMYTEKLHTIPENWITSKSRAEEHGDAEKLHTETVKLDAVREIEAEFLRIWGDKA